MQEGLKLLSIKVGAFVPDGSNKARGNDEPLFFEKEHHAGRWTVSKQHSSLLCIKMIKIDTIFSLSILDAHYVEHLWSLLISSYSQSNLFKRWTQRSPEIWPGCYLGNLIWFGFSSTDIVLSASLPAEMCQREAVLQTGPCRRHVLATTLLPYCLDEGSLLIQKQYRDNVLVLCTEIVRLPTTTSVYANLCSWEPSAYSCSWWGHLSPSFSSFRSCPHSP